MIFKQEKGIQFSNSVVTDLKSSEKYSAIKELVEKAPIFKKLKKPTEFINAIYQRELEKTTGFGHGIAVAHGKVASIGKIKVALGISARGISYNSADGKPVHLLFLIASPPEKSGAYLKTLATLMALMRNETLRNKLISSTSEKEAESLLSKSIQKIQP